MAHFAWCASFGFGAPWNDNGGFKTYEDGLGLPARLPVLCRDIRQVMKLGVATSKHAAKSLSLALQHIPLLSYAIYRREEVLAGLQCGSLEQGKNVRHREVIAWCCVCPWMCLQRAQDRRCLHHRQGDSALLPHGAGQRELSRDLIHFGPRPALRCFFSQSNGIFESRRSCCLRQLRRSLSAWRRSEAKGPWIAGTTRCQAIR